MVEKDYTGWGRKPQWRVMDADPSNNNVLIDDILKPLQRELTEVLKVEINELDKKLRGTNGPKV